jgi:hypothetical protein
MSPVEFHSIEARSFCASGRASEGLDKLGNSFQAHGLTWLAQDNAGYSRRCLGNSAYRIFKSFTAGMMELKCSLSPKVMQSFRNARQPRNKGIAPDANLIGKTLTARINRANFGYDQGSAALRSS